MCYAKAILLAYPYLEDVATTIDAQVEKRCRLSFYSNKPCYDYAERIAKLISDKRRLLLLKEEIASVLSKMTEEEMALIGYKYFKNRPIDGFDYKSRKYFRKQKKVLEKFVTLLDNAKLDEKTFLDVYGNIPYIKSIMLRLDNPLVA